MFGLLVCVICFAAPIFLARRRLGASVSAVLVVGYVYGIFRANMLDSFSYFALDASFLGLYVGFFYRNRVQATAQPPNTRVVPSLVAALVGWPVICILISPLLESQHILIQLVGLRATVFMVPLLLVGSRLDSDDVRTLGVTACVLNLAALGVAVAEIRFGVARFFPQNIVTEIIYISRDADSDMDFRIPSTFSNAHAYGGTMLMTIPLVIDLLSTKEHRRLATAGLVAAVLGIFACAARQPVVMLAIGLTLFLVFNPPRPKILLSIAAGLIAIGLMVASVDRFQRFLTLTDTEMVTERLSGSLQLNFFDVLADYPMGRGLGSSTMTSVPYFLQTYLTPRIGLENEYSVIAVEQGIVGLVIWLSLVSALLFRSNLRVGILSRSAAVLAWGICIGMWVGASIGSGMLATSPATLIFFALMGILLGKGTGEAPETKATARQQRSALAFAAPPSEVSS